MQGKERMDDESERAGRKLPKKIALTWTTGTPAPLTTKVEPPIHDSRRELVTWECKEHGVKS
jgi:hypothetical protein